MFSELFFTKNINGIKVVNIIKHGKRCLEAEYRPGKNKNDIFPSRWRYRKISVDNGSGADCGQQWTRTEDWQKAVNEEGIITENSSRKGAGAGGKAKADEGRQNDR